MLRLVNNFLSFVAFSKCTFILTVPVSPFLNSIYTSLLGRIAALFVCPSYLHFFEGMSHSTNLFPHYILPKFQQPLSDSKYTCYFFPLSWFLGCFAHVILSVIFKSHMSIATSLFIWEDVILRSLIYSKNDIIYPPSYSLILTKFKLDWFLKWLDQLQKIIKHH